MNKYLRLHIVPSESVNWDIDTSVSVALIFGKQYSFDLTTSVFSRWSDLAQPPIKHARTDDP
jgi:hypothetical protein